MSCTPDNQFRNGLLGPILLQKAFGGYCRIVIRSQWRGFLRDRAMMGRLNRDQGQLFYCFNPELMKGGPSDVGQFQSG
jgi:hypothetical protein